jgi:hypothetical protein
METRTEHLAWCKERALEYVELGELNHALVSFVSDLRKHDDTAETLRTLAPLFAAEGTAAVLAGDAAGLRRMIEGTN